MRQVTDAEAQSVVIVAKNDAHWVTCTIAFKRGARLERLVSSCEYQSGVSRKRNL